MQFDTIIKKLKEKDGRTIISVDGHKDIDSITKDIINILSKYL